MNEIAFSFSRSCPALRGWLCLQRKTPVRPVERLGKDLIEVLDENGRPVLQENTVTETMSSLGTCVPTSLNVGVGRILRVTSARDHVSVLAAIRSRELAPDGVPRLGLEFLGERWPLQRG